MGVNEKARELSELIKQTREFINLKQAKYIIDANRELKIKIEDFKKREQSLYASDTTAREAEQKAAELKRIFNELSKIPEIDRFLKAEKEFGNMLVGLYKSINDTIDLGLRSR